MCAFVLVCDFRGPVVAVVSSVVFERCGARAVPACAHECCQRNVFLCGVVTVVLCGCVSA